MKYKVGDKFIVEIEETICGYGNNPNDTGHITEPLHRIKGFNALVFDDYGLDKLQKLNPKLKIEDIDDMLAEHDLKKESYEKGLQDAWKLYMMCLKMPRNEFCKILGIKICTLGELFESIEPQEALAKIEAYEESKVFKVGDVVYADDEPDSFGVVTWKYNNVVYVMWDDGSCGCQSKTNDIHKTGRHIDIEHLLEQIRG